MADDKIKLDKLLLDLDKQHGKGAFFKIGDAPVHDIEKISTGSSHLDYCLGGGFPRGRIIELIGQESSGKTSTSLMAAVDVQRQGGRVAFIDAEHALSRDYATDLGLDVDEMFISQPNCVSIDTPILTNTGYKYYKDLDNTEDKVVSLDLESSKYNLSKFNKIDSGIKELVSVKTSKGIIETTKEHKFLTENNVFAPIGDLSKGDYIKTLLKTEHKGTLKTKDKDDGIFLGLLLADGSYTRTSIKFYKEDEGILKWIRNYLSTKYPDMELRKVGKLNYTYSIVKKVRSSKKTDLHHFVKEYLGNYSKENKKLNEIGYSQSKEFINGVLSGFISSDGYFNIKKHNVEISQISSYLNDLIYYGLMINGIPFNYYLKLDTRKESYKPLHRITITRKEGIAGFFKNIDFIGRYANTLDVKILNSKKSLLMYPKSYWKIIFNEVKLKYKNITQFSNLFFNTDRDKHLFNTKRNISKEYLIKLNCLLKSDRLDTLINADSYYVKISDITKTSSKECYDLSVPGNNNFVAGNLVVHNCGEEALEITDKVVESGLFHLVIVDSVAALTPKAEIEGEMGDSKMGLHARLMSQACRKLVAKTAKTKTTIIFINQYREKIGVMFGDNRVTTGGNALKFYASIRCEISKKGKLMATDGVTQVGHTMVMKTIKNKLAPPFRKVEVKFIYGEGVSKERELLDACLEAGIVTKGGAWFKYDGSNIGQGEPKTIEMLKDNPELVEELQLKLSEL